MEIAVIGLGYIGLPTALMFAAHGIKTTGIDINSSLIGELNQGKLSFEEDGMPQLFEAAKQNLTFTTAVPQADVYIIAVPTPFDKATKRIDPIYVIQAVRSVPNDTSIIFIESTVSPGTIDKYLRPITNNPLAHAPERIIPGNMLNELKNNARVIGADSEEIGQMIKKLYQSFCKSEIITTSIKTAEMTKVVENTYRDINIAYANELAKICHQGDLNVHEIIEIANMHPRVNILKPGPGVGGHCISVDPWFLVGDYPLLSPLIYEARKINDSMPIFVLQRVHEILPNGGTVGFYGLTYKEDVDDTRESPTLQLYEQMKFNFGGHDVLFYDPLVQNVLPNQVSDFDEFVQKSDLVVVMVGHKHIRETKINKPVLDTRNVIEGAHKL